MPISTNNSATRTASAITTALVVVSVIFPILSAVSIYLRLLARRKGKLPFHADDGWVIVAWIFTFTLSVLVWVFSAKSGINYYKIDALQGTYDSLELIFISSCLIQFPLATVKISVLLFYRRIFLSSRPFRVCVWIAIATVVFWGLVFFFLVLTQVDPISASWTGGRLRYNSTALGLAQVGTSIALDFVVLCLPLPVISQLHMASKRKLAVSMIFWLGAFCCVAAIIRLVFLDQSVRAVIHNEGSVYLQSKQFIFMIIEPNCSIIAACLPCYGTLLSALGGRAPESMLRSVRSIFSLRSRNTDNSNKGALGGNSPGATLGIKSDSQIELQTHQSWPSKSQQEVQCIGGSDGEIPALPPNRGISVTNGVTVLRE
ncbi:hypothetical protein VM1G_07108 [Cytospora mali]|uniref:Rhodopsin domain-containing protein n=1 Tax=Cytospora mali TaxID=578113 RepID=A0A194W586_CYTMA|nr:hypothetical protein VM1G_07108 [Valsa mali]